MEMDDDGSSWLGPHTDGSLFSASTYVSRPRLSNMCRPLLPRGHPTRWANPQRTFVPLASRTWLGDVLPPFEEQSRIET